MSDIKKSDTHFFTDGILDEFSNVTSDKQENVSVLQGNPSRKKIEVLCDGYFYDVTEFIKRHPGGDIINLYAESGEDATIPIQQFHFRSLKMVQARMRGLPKRLAISDEVDLDSETKLRHDQLTKEFLQLAEELETEGLMEPDPYRFTVRILQSLTMFLCGLAMSYLLGSSSIVWRVISVLVMTLAAGQQLWLGHECGHNAFTGVPGLDKIFHSFSFGFVFGLSASSWRYTHSEHHAMPQHETKDADLKTMPLLAFNKRVFRTIDQNRFWIHYQHILFVLCDTFLVTITWKFNQHPKFVIQNECWCDLFFMICHYSIVPIVGFWDWLIITWLGSIYVLGNLILSHTHLPVVENGQKLHWIEYAFLHTTNIRSSYCIDWWTGHLNYQIEHHLFPTMPEYKGKLCRDKVKAFAKRNNLPYELCSYWEAIQLAYFNLEHVANEIKQL